MNFKKRSWHIGRAALTAGNSTLLLVLFLCSPTHGSGTDSEAAAEVVRTTMTELAIPGIQAAVWADGNLVFAEAMGSADMEQSVAVTGSTRFRLGSVSKILTASLAARLTQQGVVDLDADIRTYLTTFPDKGEKITLRQLLGHLGGIRHYENKDYDPATPGGIIDLRAYPDTASAVALFEEDPLAGKPGSTYRYSTFGYTLVSAVLEAAAGKPFLQLLEDEVTSPLGLQHTTNDDLRRIIVGRTAFYDSVDGELVRAFPLNAAYKWAGGGLLSTATDLVRFGAAHFDDQFLNAETRKLLFTEQKTSDGRRTGVALGWRVGRDRQGRPIAHHAGSMAGCRAVLMTYPEHGVAVALLTNLSATPRPAESVAQEIAAIFLRQD